MSDKYFPIKTDTACRLKWSWSTIYLNSGTTASCHRASASKITNETFDEFHNTPEKIRARQLMLEGQWPIGGCEFCQRTEIAGGNSDRQFQNQIPNVYPSKLDSDSHAVVVDPVILEIFFSNTCNLKCIYCNAKFSSAIQAENKKFGGAIAAEEKFEHSENQYQQLVPKFWQWFDKNSSTLQRLQVLGGEPFLQPDVDKLLEIFESTPHPNLEFNLVTNLSLSSNIINPYLQRLRELIQSKKLKRVDMQLSIDSWDTGQEYIRDGLSLIQFEKNIKSMIDFQCFRIGLLSTVTSLSIPSMSKLCQKYLEWNKLQTIYWYMHLVLPHGESIFSPTIFDFSVFEQHLEEIGKMLPDETWDDKTSREVFFGIVSNLKQNCHTDIGKQRKLLDYLQANDQRRVTNWRAEFPWLEKEFEKNHVV